jgi:hypothetical protein
VKTLGSCRAAATLQRRSPPWRRCLGKLGAWVGYAVSVTLALLQQRSSACSRCLLGGSASWVLSLFAVKAPVHRAWVAQFRGAGPPALPKPALVAGCSRTSLCRRLSATPNLCSSCSALLVSFKLVLACVFQYLVS